MDHLKLVNMCASHIDNKARLMCLDRQIKCLLNQSIRASIYISMSYEKDMYDDLNNLIESLKKEKELTIYVHHKTRLSQFQHYSYIINNSSIHDDSWILFCDDDDICNTKRNEIYIEQIHKNKNEFIIICDVGQLCILDSSVIEMDESDVNNYYSNHHVECMTSKAIEHFMVICRSWIFKKYLYLIDDKMLRYTGCDLLWHSYLTSLPHESFESKSWIYAKMMSPSRLNHASLDLEFIEEENMFWEFRRCLKAKLKEKNLKLYIN